MKRKCLVYGNCQAIAIGHLLSCHPGFSEKYDVLNIQPVHLIKESDIPLIESLAESADLFIYQLVSDRYREMPRLSTKSLLSKIKASCQSLSLPVAYFTGYHPEITYLKNGATTIIDQPFPYHDLGILKLYAQGKCASEIINAIKTENFYNEELVQSNFENTLDSLSRRETQLDIKLSPFIRENFRSAKLFHTFNHPSNIVVEFILNSILEAAEISSTQKISEVIANTDVLSRSSFPVYPSVAKALKLEFEIVSTYKIDTELISREDVVHRFCDFYDENSASIPSFLEHTSART